MMFKSSFRNVTIIFLLSLTIASIAIIADAFARSHHSRHHSSEEGGREKKAKAEIPPTGPLFMVVSIGRQHVSVYGNDGLVARAPVSTGMRGHPTPTGIFNILEKERFHRSNIYSGAPMPFMQRITWSGVAMHAGVLPGYPASHGCIRMPGEFAKRLFGMTKGGERVVVTHGDITPANFSHPLLPVPKLRPLPDSENIASSASQVLQNALSVTEASRRPSVGMEKLDIAVKAETPRMLNPVEYAKAMKAQAAAKAQEATAAVVPARELAAQKSKEANAAASELERAESALEDVKDRIESLDRKAEKAKGDEETVEEAKTALVAAQAKLKDLEARVETARKAKAEKEEQAAEALKSFKDSELTRRAATDTAKSWNRRLEPVSILISRKTGRLYVRQGFVKVFDVPVTIKNPDAPIGTHLYLAMQPETNPNNGNVSLSWLALSVPEASAGTDSDEPRRRHRRRDRDEEESVPRISQPVSSSAAGALDRIEIPSEVSDKISEMLWSGGSLIVSDMGISRETGDHTDFIVLTR